MASKLNKSKDKIDSMTKNCDRINALEKELLDSRLAQYETAHQSDDIQKSHESKMEQVVLFLVYVMPLVFVLYWFLSLSLPLSVFYFCIVLAS